LIPEDHFVTINNTNNAAAAAAAAADDDDDTAAVVVGFSRRVQLHEDIVAGDVFVAGSL